MRDAAALGKAAAARSAAIINRAMAEKGEEILR